MQVVKGTVVAGKVVLDHGTLPDGTQVAVFVTEEAELVRLPPELRRELEEAIAEADSEDGISADELFAELRKLG